MLKYEKEFLEVHGVKTKFVNLCVQRYKNSIKRDSYARMFYNIRKKLNVNKKIIVKNGNIYPTKFKEVVKEKEKRYYNIENINIKTKDNYSSSDIQNMNYDFVEPSELKKITFRDMVSYKCIMTDTFMKKHGFTQNEIMWFKKHGFI